MSKPSKFAGILRDRKHDSEPETTAASKPKRGRPGGQGKRLNPDYSQVTAYIPTTLHDETKINLIRQGNREFSELVEELLAAWNKKQTARVTEIMAVNLLACFEEHSLKDLPNDPLLTDDLRKPEKITSPGGRVSIAATRDEAGHADGFWSLALAVRAGEITGAPFAYQRVEFPDRVRVFSRRHKGCIG